MGDFFRNGRGHIVLLKNTHIYTSIYIFYKKYFRDVSREFDEFQVNTHLCKLRCWHLYNTIRVSLYQEGSYFLFIIMVSVGIFTLGGKF